MAGLFTGIVVMAVVFLIWDAIFTANGVWGFTRATSPARISPGLPIEEWLFFLVVPYSCVFLYEVMRYFVRRDVLGRRPPAQHRVDRGADRGGCAVYRPHLHGHHLPLHGRAARLHVFVLKSPYLGRFYARLRRQPRSLLPGERHPHRLAAGRNPSSGTTTRRTSASV
jgi:hypothetical protein